MGMGANYTKKRRPVELVYFEEFQRVDDAFAREKQIQGWSRSKKKCFDSRSVRQAHCPFQIRYE